MENAYVREFDNLHVTALNREMYERTVGYWYTVTCGATAHTAFRTREELDQWLSERGLLGFPATAGSRRMGDHSGDREVPVGYGS